MNSREIWVKGEVAAREYLRAQGYRILEENFSGKMGEIDLIAEEHGQTVFVEVKSSLRLGDGAKRVDVKKICHLRDAARAYIKQYGAEDCRFDILEESDAGFRLIKNAF